MAGPLDGLRVVDLSRVLAGPWCTQILADLGAEVIKVERPGSGDDTRHWGPPWSPGENGDDTDLSAYYLCANRGKRSVTIDIGTAGGRELVRRLAARSDVLIENFRVGNLARKGLGFSDLERVNPGLVYCSITGFGQHIDLALLDVQVSWLANQAQNYFCGGTAPGRTGAEHPNLAPYQPFGTRDGNLIIAVGNDAQFGCLCAVLGLEPLARDSRFATNSTRVTHREVLIGQIEAVTLTRSSRDWLQVLRAAEIPCGPIQDIAEVFADPQVRARNMIVDLAHPVLGTLSTVASPIRYSATPVEYRKAPPLLGEDTDSVLADVLDLDCAEIARLRSNGIV